MNIPFDMKKKLVKREMVIKVTRIFISNHFEFSPKMDGKQGN